MKRIITPQDGDVYFDPLEVSRERVVFLAGGISNCPDWQAEAAEYLVEKTGYCIYNPRDPNFDASNPNAARKQITWEYNRLKGEKTGLFLFWFPKETLCPITLFEYGKILTRTSYRIRDKSHEQIDVFVGAHLEYARREDIIIQTELEIGYTPHINNDLTKLLEGLEHRWRVRDSKTYSRNEFKFRQAYLDV